MTEHLTAILGLFFSLGPLVLLQRALHKEIQAIFLLISRRVNVSIILFSILFFPGVLLHEGSHFVMAKLLRVPTGGFSLIPRPLANGKVQLGYVVTARADWARDAMIGIAPLLVGGCFVAYTGLVQLDLLELWENLLSGGFASAAGTLRDIYSRPDFWLWFYLTLVISSTMLPSASDRRSWLPIGLIFALLIGSAILAGAGPWMVDHLAVPLFQGVKVVTVVFAMSSVVHLILWLPSLAIRGLLSKLTGVKVI